MSGRPTSSWKDRRILLLGGPGGVGKTTLAAALGVHFSKQGKRTVVLTVDPAKRLAQALGFAGFADEIQEVRVPGAPAGTLFATMLDTQRYLDRVMARFAKNEDQKNRILNNPLYRTTIDTMGGTQEYAAMERLLEFAQDPKWEKILVDTPPTSNAVDLLSAPQRLANFMDSSVLRWFQGENQPRYLGLFRRSTRLAMRFLEKLFGSEFLNTFSRFMDDLEGMHTGFRNRHEEVLRLLQGPDSAFVLVTYPSEARFQECSSFLETLREQKLPLASLILNRVEPAFPPPSEAPESAKQVRAILDFYARIHEAQATWVERLRGLVPHLPSYTLPRQSGALHDLPSLARLAELLVN